MRRLNLLLLSSPPRQKVLLQFQSLPVEVPSVISDWLNTRSIRRALTHASGGSSEGHKRSSFGETGVNHGEAEGQKTDWKDVNTGG